MQRFAECVDDCTRVIKSNFPNERSEAYRIRSLAHLHTGAFKLAYNDAVASGDRRHIQQCDEALQAAKRTDAAPTSENLDRLLRLAPRAVPYVVMRADLAWEAGDRDLWFSLIDPVVADLVKNVQVQFRHGLLLFCNNRLDDAKQSLANAAKLRGCSNCSAVQRDMKSVAHNRIQANRHLQQKKLRDAELAINRTYAAASGSCPPFSLLCQSAVLLKIRLLRLRGDIDGAIALIDKTIDGATHADLDLYLERGDAKLEKGEFDAALSDYQTVLQMNGNSRRAAEGARRAERAKSEAQRVDLYKLLNVTKDATREEISASYRGLVRKWHPDQFKDPEKKAVAEEHMKKLNAAFEVLTNDEERRKYDMGGSDFSGSEMFTNFNFVDPMELFNQFFQQAGGGADAGGGTGFQFQFQFNF
jgi:tetratricopeptide (TPR) repeat protein